MDPIALLAGLAVGCIIGFLAARLLKPAPAGQSGVLEERLSQFQNRNEELNTSLDQARSELAQLRSAAGELEKEAAALKARQELLQGQESELGESREENASLREQLSRAQTSLEQERRHGEQRLKDLQDAQKTMENRFKVLAEEILEAKGKVLSDSNKEQLSGILTPLREQLGEFKTRVEETYDKEARERHSLVREIQNLKTLNERISEDALNLTKALKGQSKAQGNWGEMILERVLEMSGLEKGREFTTQQAYRDREKGSRYIPDVVVHLPDNRHLVVDSKVSLVAYERFCSCPEEEREQHLKEHLTSLREHIRQLADKPYSHLEELNTVDFVFLFIPIEAAFTEAMRFDNALFNEAMGKHIVLVTPSTLLATLRAVESSWRLDKQNKNAREIAKEAGNLYDKFVNFVIDLKGLGQRLEQAQATFDGAMNKLSTGKGNLVTRVEKLKTLGAKASKQLDHGLVEDARSLSPGTSNPDPDDLPKTPDN